MERVSPLLEQDIGVRELVNSPQQKAPVGRFLCLSALHLRSAAQAAV